MEMSGFVSLIDTGGPAKLDQTVSAGWVSMSRGRSTKADRNREVFIAYQAGRTAGQLAETFGLAIFTVRSIIYHERNKSRIDESYLADKPVSLAQP